MLEKEGNLVIFRVNNLSPKRLDDLPEVRGLIINKKCLSESSVPLVKMPSLGSFLSALHSRSCFFQCSSGFALLHLWFFKASFSSKFHCALLKINIPRTQLSLCHSSVGDLCPAKHFPKGNTKAPCLREALLSCSKA